MKIPNVNRSLVQRNHSIAHLLICLICFAFSVTATRLFLEITGYPQIGSGEIHVAHVLWGGLFLFIASLLPLIWINQWVLNFSAVLSGLGVGLFMDEVGKFITANNNYFYPVAAPIIYAFFLLLLIAYFFLKRGEKPSSRKLMYKILEEFGEVLDHNLSKEEYENLSISLEQIIEKNEDQQLVKMAFTLQDFLQEKKNLLVPDQPDFVRRFQLFFQNLSRKLFTKIRLRRIIITGLVLWASWALISQIVVFQSIGDASRLTSFIGQSMAAKIAGGSGGFLFFKIQTILEGVMGVVALLAVILFFYKKERAACWLGIISLLITLVIVNLLTFYYSQFSTIGFAVYQCLLLFLLLLYKQKFIDRKKIFLI